MMSFDMPPDDESAIEYEYAKEVAQLKQQRDDLLDALRIIARGDYDNAHDCKAAAKIAAAAIGNTKGGA